MSFAKPIIVLLLIFSLNASVRAQAPAASEKEQQRQRWRRQAIDTIKQVAADTSTWSDKETAIEALTDAADSIWKHDADLGAEWLSKAWSLADGVAATANDEKLKEFFSASVQSRLRTRVLGALGSMTKNWQKHFWSSYRLIMRTKKRRAALLMIARFGASSY